MALHLAPIYLLGLNRLTDVLLCHQLFQLELLVFSSDVLLTVLPRVEALCISH